MNDKVDKKQFEQDYKTRKLKTIKVLDQQKNDIFYEVHLGEIIVKQNQFDILLARMDAINNNLNNKMDAINTNLNNKMEEGFSKVNHRLDKVETRLDVIESDVSEIKTILKKHDDLFVEHKWLSKPSF